MAEVANLNPPGQEPGTANKADSALGKHSDHNA